MKHVKTLSTALLLAGTALFVATPAMAGGVAAGTLIENTATATFSVGGDPQTVDSNTVTLRVDELLDVTVASQDAGPVAINAGSAVLTFELTNIGNGPEAFLLTADPAVTGNDFDGIISGIAYDLDGNGQYDAGTDYLLGASEATPDIAADGTLTVFVLVDSPGSLTDADLSQVNLMAAAVTGTGAPGTAFAGEGAGGGDAVVGTTGADGDDNGQLVARIIAVSLSKSASVLDPFGGAEVLPGSVVTYTITATVTGSGAIDDLLVTDAIPAGTTYQPGSLALDSAALTDAAGDDAGEGGVAGIAVTLGTVTAGSAHDISFNVTVDED
jgi:uncharacterized repeat protein (TIGR01451 family)